MSVDSQALPYLDSVQLINKNGGGVPGAAPEIRVEAVAPERAIETHPVDQGLKALLVGAVMGLPSLVTNAGMMVWNGRLRGAT